ncbi:MAG: GDYXXLXY domain-containing protein [Gammaproteobacteria bacterium]|nr:GDYXXLXY domain-containing protein [Gammaproteobacteria bacterium]
MDSKIALAALILILVLVNWSIAGKEKHLAEGSIVYLELAPVDPRSLIQGDYMALRFRDANKIYSALPKKDKQGRRWRSDVDASDGYAVFKLDEKGIGSFKSIYDEQTLAEDEILMRYRVRNGKIKLASNAFFFQEGLAEIYQPARYGQFRVDSHGELLLVAMCDKELKLLE